MTGRKIEMGYIVKDIITGFEGVAIGRTDWLYSCSRIGVRSSEIVKGKPIDDQWFDEQQLEIVEESKPPISKDSSTDKPGRDKSAPPRQNHG